MQVHSKKITMAKIVSLIMAISWLAISFGICFIIWPQNQISNALFNAKNELRIEVNHSKDLIDSQISLLKEQPLLVSQLPSIKLTLSKTYNPIEKELKKEELIRDPELHKLSLTLSSLNKSIGASQIFLMNNTGYSIASSNWSSPETSIGTNYKDRINFLHGLAGKDSIHYAMGRTTHRAGLFFSHPIISNDRFYGILVIKYDLNKFLELENHIETSMLDDNNVIVASMNSDLYLKSINYKNVSDHGDYFDRYLTYKITPLKLVATDKNQPELLKIGNDRNYYLKEEAALNEYSMRLVSFKKFDAHAVIYSQAMYLFIFMASVGIALIIIGMLIAIYLFNVAITNKKLWFNSHHNSLTGLPNNEQLLESLETLKKENGNKNFYLYLVDIDGFRNINRRYGRSSGDLLLKKISERLKSLIPKAGILFNNSLDKFSILCPGDSYVNDEEFVQSIQKALKLPFRINNSSILITVSISSVTFNLDENDNSVTLNNAELALNRIKSFGGNDYLPYSDELQISFLVEYDVSKDLLNIASNDHLLTLFQPIVSLSTGKVDKAELLTRLKHPSHGMISPGIFIPLAERNGTILEIGNYCRRQALIYARKWSDITGSKFQISINKSPNELRSSSDSADLDGFFEDIKASKLSGSNFCFELTENQLIEENEISSEKLRKLTEFGISLAVDDFGTGYSSMAYIKRFPISTIKLDMSIIKELKANSDSQIICSSIIEMAHKLNLTVIAEGVENQVQHHLLIEMGCDYAQGFLYSPPISSDQFEKLLFVAKMAPFDVSKESK